MEVEIPVTVEIEKEIEVTREVPVTVEVEIPVTVEVEKEIEVTREVPVTVEVEIPVTVEVEKIVEVEVAVPVPVPQTAARVLDGGRVLVDSVARHIDHGQNSGKIDELEVWKGNVADVLVSAVFHNPYPVETGSWSYGFTVRVVERNLFGTQYHEQYYIGVRSDGSWFWEHVTPNPTRFRDNNRHKWDHLGGGLSNAIRTGGDDSNTVGVLVKGSTGTLTVNGKTIGEVVLEHEGAGPVRVVANVYDDDGMEGMRTSFEELTVVDLGETSSSH